MTNQTDATATLILRAVGKGWYQFLEVDLSTATVVSAWPAYNGSFEPTPRLTGRKPARPSDLKGDAGKAYRAAFKAWDGRACNFDRPAPPKIPAGAKLLLRQASHVGSNTRPWVAAITGASGIYRFARTFIRPDATERGGVWTWYLADGLYEICNRNSKGKPTRSFRRVEAGELIAVEADEVSTLFPAIERPADLTGGVERCPICGRRGYLVEDLEDGIEKCPSCCDMPSA